MLYSSCTEFSACANIVIWIAHEQFWASVFLLLVLKGPLDSGFVLLLQTSTPTHLDSTRRTVPAGCTYVATSG